MAPLTLLKPVETPIWEAETMVEQNPWHEYVDRAKPLPIFPVKIAVLIIQAVQPLVAIEPRALVRSNFIDFPERATQAKSADIAGMKQGILADVLPIGFITCAGDGLFTSTCLPASSA